MVNARFVRKQLPAMGVKDITCRTPKGFYMVDVVMNLYDGDFIDPNGEIRFSCDGLDYRWAWPALNDSGRRKITMLHNALKSIKTDDMKVYATVRTF